MPIDPADLAGFVTGQPIEAAELTARLRTIETFLNGGIEAGDLRASAWVGAAKVDPPDFYGSPAPRFEGPRCAVHWRRAPGQVEESALYVDDAMPDSWATIPHLAARVRVHPQVTGRAVPLLVMASWYTYELGGSIPYDPNDIEQPAAQCAEFQLAINGSRIASTSRDLYYGSDQSTDFTRKMHSIAYLAPSILSTTTTPVDVGIQVKVLKSGMTGTNRNWKFIWVQARNFVAAPFYF